MKLRQLLAFAAVAALVVVTVTGCNTMRGLGKDIERGGEKLQDASDG
jgi:entericidin B